MRGNPIYRMPSTYPLFVDTLSKLWEAHAEDVEYARNHLVKIADTDIVGFPSQEGTHSLPYMILELNSLIQEVHFYEVSDDIKELLLRTKSPKKADFNLPFEYIYVDVRFTKEEMASYGFHLDAEEIFGVVIRVGDIVLSRQGENTPIGKDIRLSVGSHTMRTEGMYRDLHTFSDVIETFDGSKADIDNPALLSLNDQRVISDWAVNFIYFLNNPDVKEIAVVRSEKNQARRQKQNKPVLPTSYRIEVTGETLRYLNEVRAGIRSECQYAFEVRGHYRVLQSEFYKHRRGTRVWVGHFTKGKEKGFLVEKYYDVKTGGNTDG